VWAATPAAVAPGPRPTACPGSACTCQMPGSQTNPTWLPWLEKSCFGCFGPKQNIQNSQGLHIFPASHLALNGKRHRVITSYPPVAGTVFPAATVSAPGHAACRLMMRTVGPRFGDPEAAGGYCWKCGRGAVNTLDMSMYLQYHMIYIYI
jgi:hypothetical protein